MTHAKLAQAVKVRTIARSRVKSKLKMVEGVVVPDNTIVRAVAPRNMCPYAAAMEEFPSSKGGGVLSGSSSPPGGASPQSTLDLIFRGRGKNCSGGSRCSDRSV